ncbi:hypothetical protein LX32DRAFT_902 [Colletotrichum zoysiae]|uniref:Uncharacterized protein n=1 Tax=Colletotrichum zoysiae TaxID=1216348 RepID=A0AAD9HW07_9PEZI|nr:hypothetical protein LX32DRAFT_902 [Colletotrichum zoysiae]
MAPACSCFCYYFVLAGCGERRGDLRGYRYVRTGIKEGGPKPGAGKERRQEGGRKGTSLGRNGTEPTNRLDTVCRYLTQLRPGRNQGR